MQTLIHSFVNESGENDSVMSVDRAISDPIFLCFRGWRINDELFGFFVVMCCSFHFNSVVTFVCSIKFY